MTTWRGSACCCVNETGQLLMVLQGKQGETLKWSVPSGQIESGEDFVKCCLRETYEETGYDISVSRELFVKQGHSYGIEVEVHYFLAEISGGSACINDPDGLIHEVGWKSAADIMELDLSFPEDREFLLTLANGRGEIPHSEREMGTLTGFVDDFQGFFEYYQSVWNQCDIDAMCSICARDLRVRWAYPANQVSDWGYEEACQGWRQAFETYAERSPRWFFHKPSITPVGLNEVLAVFWVTFDIDGKPTNEANMFVETFRKDEQGWKLIRSYVESSIPRKLVGL